MAGGLRDVLTVAAVAALVFFTNLGGYPLFDEDEPKNTVCGVEMLRRGDWVVPTFNEELRTDKPILIYWLMLCSFHAFGVSEFSARFGSSLLSIGTALGTYYLGRKLYDRQVGLLAGIAVVTCLMFSAVGRAVTPDATLVCCVTWCFCGFVWAWKKAESQESSVKSQQETTDSASTSGSGRWTLDFRLLPMYAAMGLAMLAKGPVGFLLPCMVLGLFGQLSSVRAEFASGAVSLGEGPLWLRTHRLMNLIFAPRRFLRTLRGMKLWMGVPVAFGIALPWFILVGLRTDGTWLAGFLGGHNVNRFLQPMEQHRGPFAYYLPVLLAGSFPWSIFLPSALRDVARRIRSADEGWDADLFLTCWTLTWTLFFSCAQTKLPNYILPVYPAVAITIARSIVGWMRDPAVSQSRFLMQCRALAVVGVLMIAGITIAMLILIPDEQPLALLGAIPVLMAAVAFRYAKQEQRQQAVVSIGIGAVLLSVAMTGWAPLRLARYQDSPFFAQAAQAAAPVGTAEIATFEVFEPSLVYYHGRKIHRPQPDELATFVADHPHAFVLTRSDKLDLLPADVSERLVEVARQRRFLRRHDLVLLGSASVMASKDRAVQ